MFKKSFMALAALLLFASAASLARAGELINSPVAQFGAVATDKYTGYDSTTTNIYFNINGGTNAYTLTRQATILAEVAFSTGGSATDFVQCFDSNTFSTSTGASSANGIVNGSTTTQVMVDGQLNNSFRVYNQVAGSSIAVTNGGPAALGVPKRVGKGLTCRASVGSYNWIRFTYFLE